MSNEPDQDFLGGVDIEIEFGPDGELVFDGKPEPEETDLFRDGNGEAGGSDGS